jgi:hypothetical protein
MSSLFSFYSEIKDEQVKLFYKSLDEMGADADALAKMKRTLVCRQGGRLYPSVGWWYDFQKRRLLETEKAHHETMLAMMLLAQSPQQSQPQPWLPVELWDMVALEFLPLQNPLYAMLTQNGTNEIVVADLHTF